jgi:hypothetical protein
MVQRGRCGEPIGPACSDAQREGPDLPHLGPEFNAIRGGWYVRDSLVFSAPFAEDDETEAGRWRVCPTSAMRAVLPLVSLYRRHKLGIEPITQAVRVPSAALVEAIEVMTVADIEADNAALRLAMGGAGG